jgi:hypothetical protein
MYRKSIIKNYFYIVFKKKPGFPKACCAIERMDPQYRGTAFTRFLAPCEASCSLSASGSLFS